MIVSKKNIVRFASVFVYSAKKYFTLLAVISKIWVIIYVEMNKKVMGDGL